MAPRKRPLGSADAPHVAYPMNSKRQKLYSEAITAMIEAIETDSPVRPSELLFFLQTYKQLVSSGDDLQRVEAALKNAEMVPGGWRIRKGGDRVALARQGQVHVLRRPYRFNMHDSLT